MRDENKSDYYVARPVIDTDSYHASFVRGYTPLLYYRDVLVQGAESKDNEKFGNRDQQTVRIAHDDNDGVTPDIKVNDGVWLEQPIADTDGLYQAPPYIVDSVQKFRRKHVFVLRRTVDAK